MVGISEFGGDGRDIGVRVSPQLLCGLLQSTPPDRRVAVDQLGHGVGEQACGFGHGQLRLGEPSPEYHLVPSPKGEGDCYSLGLYCENAAALVVRAVEAGATIREPLTTFVSGDRFASIRDPFAVRWSVMSRVEDISEEESARWVARGLPDPNAPSGRTTVLLDEQRSLLVLTDPEASEMLTAS